MRCWFRLGHFACGGRLLWRRRWQARSGAWSWFGRRFRQGVLWGEEAGENPGQDVAVAIPDARLVILPSVGHYLPDAVCPQIAGELRALADRAR